MTKTTRPADTVDAPSWADSWPDDDDFRGDGTDPFDPEFDGVIASAVATLLLCSECGSPCWDGDDDVCAWCADAVADTRAAGLRELAEVL